MIEHEARTLPDGIAIETVRHVYPDQTAHTWVFVTVPRNVKCTVTEERPEVL